MTALPPLDTVSPDRLRAGSHEELALEQTKAWPHLAAVLEVWRNTVAVKGRLPDRLDPLSLPRQVLPFIMLLDLEKADTACLRIRLAGTEVCAKHGREMKGLTTRDFFSPEDAETVVQAALKMAADGRPSLARRSYITIADRRWSYIRLMLPLSRDGTDIGSFFKVADPASMNAKLPLLT